MSNFNLFNILVEVPLIFLYDLNRNSFDLNALKKLNFS